MDSSISDLGTSLNLRIVDNSLSTLAPMCKFWREIFFLLAAAVAERSLEENLEEGRGDAILAVGRAECSIFLLVLLLCYTIYSNKRRLIE